MSNERFVNRDLGISRQGVLLGVTALLMVAGSLFYAHQQSEQARAAELALDRQEALADSTRQVYAQYLAWLNGRAHTYQRRAVQEDLEQTDTEEEVGVDPRARTRVTISVPGVDTTGLPSPDPVSMDGETRVASLIYEEEPFRLEATARVPPPPDTATWDVSVAMEAIRAELTVGCGEAPEGRSIRPATANLTVPEWVSVELTEVRQEPAVCNPSSGWLFGWDPPGWLEVAVPLAGGIEIGRRLSD